MSRGSRPVEFEGLPPEIAIPARISRILCRLKALYPRENATEESALPPVVRSAHLGGKGCTRAVITFQAKGCILARSPSGGCSICGLFASTAIGSTPDYTAQLRRSLTMLPAIPPVVCLYNAGSFLNPEEVDEDQRRSTLSILASVKEIKKVVIESLPGFISEESVHKAVNVLGGKQLEIGIGLETASDDIRHYCLNKRIALSDVESAVKTIAMIPGTSSLVYVHIKPPFLTEREAIVDSLRTIDAAVAMGADSVSLEPVTVQRYTLLHLLDIAGLYRPPWLWTVREILWSARRFGGKVWAANQYTPPPYRTPSNCPRCDHDFRLAIENYVARRRADCLARLACECKEEWEEALKVEDGRDLKERILAALDVIESIKVGDDSPAATPTTLGSLGGSM